MPHHPEQNVLRELFILVVSLDVVGTKALRARKRHWHLSAVIRVALPTNSPVGSRSREGADLEFKSRMNSGNSASIRLFAAALSFSDAPSWFVHWSRSSKVMRFCLHLLTSVDILSNTRDVDLIRWRA